MNKYPEIEIARKTGREKFHSKGIPLSHDLISFWQWSTSDLVSNTMRGILAEYIVAMAVGEADNYRTEWSAYDIESNEGIKVEVKSGAYIQSWSQKKLSNIQFNISPTHGWDSKTNIYSTKVVRQSDVYVFCVLQHKVQATIDPLNLDQWDFYVLSTKDLDQAVGDQKTISLGKLLELKPIAVPFGNLCESIEQVAKV